MVVVVPPPAAASGRTSDLRDEALIDWPTRIDEF